MKRLSSILGVDLHSPLNRLIAFLICNQIVIGLVAHVSSSAASSPSSWDLNKRVLSIHGGDDSWAPMNSAIEKLAAEPDVPLYSTLVFEEGVKFQYPPMSLPPYQLVRTGVETVSTDHNRAFALIGVFCAIAIGLITAWILARGMKQNLTRGSAVLFSGLGLFAALTFYPLIRGIELGQVQTWISLAFAAALFAAMTGRLRVSGALVGLMCLFKPHYGLFVLWAAWRKEWGFIVALIGAGFVASLVSLFLYGFHQHVDYLNVLSYLSRHGEAFFPNQSINGLLNRLYGLAQPELYNNLEFDKSGFPPFNPVVYSLSMMATVTFVVTAVFSSRRALPLSFAIMMLSITMASPIAWEHHYGNMLPMYAVAFVALWERKGALIWLAVSYVLASHLWIVSNLVAGSPLNLLQSYLFVGAMILLVLMHWAAADCPDRPWRAFIARLRRKGQA